MLEVWLDISSVPTSSSQLEAVLVLVCTTLDMAGYIDDMGIDRLSEVEVECGPVVATSTSTSPQLSHDCIWVKQA